MISYQDRCEAETSTGHPALPCPRCGHDDWYVHRPYRKSKRDRPLLFVAECGHCHIVETAHHVDGGWLYMHQYSKIVAKRDGSTWPETSLREFVQEYAADLREAK